VARHPILVQGRDANGRFFLEDDPKLKPRKGDLIRGKLLPRERLDAGEKRFDYVEIIEWIPKKQTNPLVLKEIKGNYIAIVDGLGVNLKLSDAESIAKTERKGSVSGGGKKSKRRKTSKRRKSTKRKSTKRRKSKTRRRCR
jgi:hypothetical protein